MLNLRFLLSISKFYKSGFNANKAFYVRFPISFVYIKFFTLSAFSVKYFTQSPFTITLDQSDHSVIS